jgi:hypothetical protein
MLTLMNFRQYKNSVFHENSIKARALDLMTSKKFEPETDVFLETSVTI